MIILHVHACVNTTQLYDAIASMYRNNFANNAILKLPISVHNNCYYKSCKGNDVVHVRSVHHKCPHS